MKKLLSLLLALLLTFSVLAGCGESDTSSKDDDEETKEEKEEKEEKKGSKGSSKSKEDPVFYVKNNSKVMMLFEGEEPVRLKYIESAAYHRSYMLSPDNSIIYYLIDTYEWEYENKAEDWTNAGISGTLVWASVDDPNDYTEIDEDVTSFALINGKLAYEKSNSTIHNKFYISSDNKSAGEEFLPDMNSDSNFYITKDMKTAIYINDVDELVLADLSAEDETIIAEDVSEFYVDYKTEQDSAYSGTIDFDPSDDIFYMTDDNDLYIYSDGEEEKIASDVNYFNYTDGSLVYSIYDENKDTYTICTYLDGESEEILDNMEYCSLYERIAYNYGENYEGYDDIYYITNNGEAVSLDNDIDDYATTSDADGEYIITAKKEKKGYTFLFYTVDKDGSLSDGEEIEFDEEGLEFSYANLYGDIIKATFHDKDYNYCEYLYIADKWVEAEDSSHTWTTDDYMYFITYEHNLYKISLEDGKKKIIAENVTDMYIANGNLYYVGDWDEKKGIGNLYKEGSEEAIDEDVSALGIQIFTYDKCADCGKDIIGDDYYWEDDDKICGDCYDDELVEEATESSDFDLCDFCGVYVDDLYYHDGYDLCHDCFYDMVYGESETTSYTECEICGDYIDDPYYYDGYYLCYDCYLDY